MAARYNELRKKGGVEGEQTRELGKAAAKKWWKTMRNDGEPGVPAMGNVQERTPKKGRLSRRS